MRCIMLVFYIIVSCAVLVESRRKVGLGQSKLYSRVDEYKTCAYNKNGNFAFENITTTKYGAHDFVVDGVAHIYRLIDMTKVLIKIKRCPNSAVESSCEHWQTWTFSGSRSCDRMLQRDLPWVTIFHRYTPVPNCPLRKGDYTLHNGTLSLEHLSHLPIPFENNYWRPTVDIFDKDGFVGCFEMAFAVYKARN